MGQVVVAMVVVHDLDDFVMGLELFLEEVVLGLHGLSALVRNNDDRMVVPLKLTRCIRQNFIGL